MTWYFRALKKYAVFAGRARRKEFWWFAFWNAGVFLGPTYLAALLGITVLEQAFSVIALLYAFVAFVPAIAVGVRRLHDTGKDGAWLLLSLVPLLGLILVVWWSQESDPGDNEYGPNPVADSA